jgi:hypothetical protein
MGTSQTWMRDVPCDACSGPGALCAEAQADGVPCSEIRACEKCGRAIVAVAVRPESSAAVS